MPLPRSRDVRALRAAAALSVGGARRGVPDRRTRPPIAAAIEAAIRREAGPLLREVTLFDVFRFPDGRRSLAWRLTFQADDRTLTDDEVNAIHARVAARVGAELGLTLRA